MIFLFISILSVQFSSAQSLFTLTKSGHINAEGLFKLVYVPIDIPGGIARIEVKEIYTDSDNPAKDVLNIGIYDPRGFTVGNPQGFRGWSGGAKTEFFIDAGEASTGYIPGKIQKGVWNILIYPSTITPEGIDWKLEVKLIPGPDKNPFVVMPAQLSVNNRPGWYRGDLHMHTLNSDGKRTQQQLVDEAKQIKLDYIISTEHNTNSANLSWGKYNSPDLLIINGEEVTTTEFGHWNAIGLKTPTYIDWRYTPKEPMIGQMIDKVHRDGGLAIINHAFFNAKFTNSFGFDVNLFDGIEVWNGTWNVLNNLALKWWDEQLKLGKKKIAIGASDTHQANNSVNNLGGPQTVVNAASLSSKNIIAGIKAGRVYIAASNLIKVDILVTSGNKIAGIGDTLLSNTNSPLKITVKTEKCPNANLTLYGANGAIKKQTLSAEDKETVNWEIDAGDLKYLRAEVRDSKNSMLALTNPVWIN